MFKIIRNPTFTHDVPVMVPVDGGHVQQSLKATFRVVPQDELAHHDLRTAEGTETYCRAIVAGFGDLVDEAGVPLAPSEAMNDQLFRTAFVQIALIRAYTLALAKARAGNRSGPGGPGPRVRHGPACRDGRRRSPDRGCRARCPRGHDGNRTGDGGVQGVDRSRAGRGGGAAARDEADALQELTASLEGEIAALRVTDPLQQEVSQHREALAGATDAERQKDEELIATRERERAAMEAIASMQAFTEDLINQGLEALFVKGESLQEVLKGVIASLAKAAIQAAHFGSGPLGGLFGGKGIRALLLPVPGKAAGGPRGHAACARCEVSA